MHLSEKLMCTGIVRHLENQDWYRNRSPRGFYSAASALIPWLASGAAISCAVALYLGFFVVPLDPHRGEVVRIAFIHAPASWVAMLVYLAMTTLVGIGLAFDARFAAMAAQALAPTGLMLAFLALWTGCLWSRAIVGSWWIPDLHTYSELAVAFLFIGFIVLHAGLEDLPRSNRIAAVPLLVGILGIPFSVSTAEPWATVNRAVLADTMGASGASAGELLSLLAMGLGFLMYVCVAALLRLDCIVLEEESQGNWAAPPENAAPRTGTPGSSS